MVNELSQVLEKYFSQKQAADHAQRANPSVIEMAGESYTQHPALVKRLSAAAVAMSRMARRLIFAQPTLSSRGNSHGISS